MILEPGKTPLPKAQAPAKAGRRPPSWQARSGPPSPEQPGVRGALAAPPEEIVLDLDATDDPCTAARRGASSTAIMVTTATYQPFCIFGSDLLLCGKLRRANIDACGAG